MPGTNTCMGIYQFKDNPNKRIFNDIIYPLIETHTGLKCLDGLSHYEAVTIKMDLIGRLIEEAKLVIVDISYKNPNVFLELGMAYVSKKPIIFLCSRNMYSETWNGNMPFDTRGKELLIFESDNDLKIQLGKFVSDCLFKTQYKCVSWISTYAKNHVKSASELEFFVPPKDLHETPEFWSSVPIHNNFIIRYHVEIHEFHDNRNPDLRLYLSPSRGGYPRIGIIFPWEISEIDNEKYECHIDVFQIEEPLEQGIRKQQIPVCKKQSIPPLGFDVFISFYYPNLVFESTLFDNEVDRLVVPLSDFDQLNYPTHFSQYIGFRSGHHISISNISIKEVFI